MSVKEKNKNAEVTGAFDSILKDNKTPEKLQMDASSEEFWCVE